MILDAILKVDLDLRQILGENLVLIGGTSMSLGTKYYKIECSSVNVISLSRFQGKTERRTSKATCFGQIQCVEY